MYFPCRSAADTVVSTPSTVAKFSNSRSENISNSACHFSGSSTYTSWSIRSFSYPLISSLNPSTDRFTGEMMSRVSTSGRSWNSPVM
ncbi:MAG: hypothetical protein A2559_02935 [Deltaproteobacteria bacterium RIFOXYD2_FULL_66_9]|nr:MAG: hypothetical protein A2559_02935 [Deltaproteobacteria bacterium RIFOXYD2_FULL_66_9]